jgi:hypothetical protein
MKRYIPFFFLFLAWAAAEGLTDIRRMPAVAGVAAAWICFLLIPKRPVGGILSAAILIGTGFYNADFALRCAPMLLLCYARCAAGAPAAKKKQTGRADGVYTLVLASVLFAVGILIADIVFFARNRVTDAFRPLYSAAFFAAVGCAAAGVFAFSQKKAVGKLFGAAYAAAGVCAVFASVGFFINFGLYDVCLAAFPWLLWLASGAADDPLIAAVSAALPQCLQARTDVGE